jgi:hypothetical protein
MSRRSPHSTAVVADMSGGDSLRLPGGRLKKGAHGGNMVSPVLDTLREVLLDGERIPSS